MSGFKPYPAYKDSGVEWLGEVPAHWNVTLLKRGYEVVLGKMLQPKIKRDNDELLPYLRAANIQPSGVDTFDVKRMWFGVEEKKSLLLLVTVLQERRSALISAAVTGKVDVRDWQPPASAQTPELEEVEAV